MKQRRLHIIFRTLLLVFISTGIFISSFHYHSDTEWQQPQTETHHENEPFCPICNFHLKAVTPEATTLTASLTVAVFIPITNESQKPDLYTGPLTGRSPPVLS